MRSQIYYRIFTINSLCITERLYIFKAEKIVEIFSFVRRKIYKNKEKMFIHRKNGAARRMMQYDW